MNSVSFVSPLLAAGLMLIIWFTFGVLIAELLATIAGVDRLAWPGTKLFPFAVGMLWPLALFCTITMWRNKHEPPTVPGEHTQVDETPLEGNPPRTRK